LLDYRTGIRALRHGHHTLAKDGNMKARNGKRKSVAFFGHFDSTNFGNESTLQAILHHLRRFYPYATVICICTGHEATTATHHIEAIPISDNFFKSWAPRNSLIRKLRKLCLGLIEPCQWMKGFWQLRGTDMLIVPGTGLLTDAFGLLSWGPYNLFKWSMIAKLCRCKLAFVSVGAGPVNTTLGRYFIKTMLYLADFRSYRDESTVAYLRSMGVNANSSQVYPDLAFSLPEDVIPQRDAGGGRRSVVGLGLMGYYGPYSTPGTDDGIYSNYLESVAQFAEWLLERGYDIRLLSGELGDMGARREFRARLKGRVSAADEARISDEPVWSVADVLAQISATDIVVATRFHSALLSFLCTKPVISISFHHKCESLMRSMGMSEYCLSIGALNADKLIERFCVIERRSGGVELVIKERVRRFREILDQQYALIFEETKPRIYSAAPSGDPAPESAGRF
jgi:polysaccharide pyruvyl transferase WcaK-like protein